MPEETEQVVTTTVTKRNPENEKKKSKLDILDRILGVKKKNSGDRRVAA